MIEDNKMTQHRESMSHVGAANDANDETIRYFPQLAILVP